MLLYYMELLSVAIPFFSMLIYAIGMVLKELRAMRADMRLMQLRMENLVSKEKCEIHRQHFENKLESLQMKRRRVR